MRAVSDRAPDVYTQPAAHRALGGALHCGARGGGSGSERQKREQGQLRQGGCCEGGQSCRARGNAEALLGAQTKQKNVISFVNVCITAASPCELISAHKI